MSSYEWLGSRPSGSKAIDVDKRSIVNLRGTLLKAQQELKDPSRRTSKRKLKVSDAIDHVNAFDAPSDNSLEKKSSLYTSRIRNSSYRTSSKDVIDFEAKRLDLSKDNGRPPRGIHHALFDSLENECDSSIPEAVTLDEVDEIPAEEQEKWDKIVLAQLPPDVQSALLAFQNGSGPALTMQERTMVDAAVREGKRVRLRYRRARATLEARNQERITMFEKHMENVRQQ